MELAMIFVGGLLGSGHCLGMCGPLVLAIGTPAPDWSSNLKRQFAFSLGRIFTYAVLGAAAGYIGMRLITAVPAMINAQAMLAIVAGILLIAQGLVSARAIRLPRVGPLPACLAPGLLGVFMRQPQLRGIFLAGVFTGLVPCGLVYAFVALAASTASLIDGISRMAAFGAGTMPVLVAMGTSGSLVKLTTRRRVLSVAAWFVVATGIVSIMRGAGYVGWTFADPLSCCRIAG